MKLLFTGTGSGKTSLERFHSSLIFKLNDKNILIDSGEGISKALLAQSIDYNSITDIIISHYHSDHLSGLPSLLTQMIISNRTLPLRIYTHKDLSKSLLSFLQISFIFIEKLKFEVEIVGFDFQSEISISKSFVFRAKQNSHIRNKYKIELNDLKFISSSFLFSLERYKIIYTSDISEANDLYLFQDIIPDIFITEATHVALSKIEDAITILNPTKCYLTHIDDQIGINEWFQNLEDELRRKINIAYDGMELILV